jgi:hypothetical protein
MPHDVNGNELEVGDAVWVRCRVTAIQTGDEYCNCTLETVEPMYPGTHHTVLSLNARQVLKPLPGVAFIE